MVGGQASDVLIREVTEADLSALMDLYFELSQQGQSPEPRAATPTARHREALRELIRGGPSTCLVLEVDGRVRGSITIHIVPNLTYGGRPAALVENVVVDEALQRRGYGRALMERAEAVAREHDCHKVALTSNRKRTEAHRFYERIGYNVSHHGFTKYLGVGSESGS